MSYPEYLSAEEKLTDGKRRLGIRDVVVLCGSMRFADQMAEVAIEESVGGALVLKPDCNMKLPHPLWADPAQDEALKARLDDQHRQKIRLADRVIVVGNYIGDSTRGEIAYARELGKPIRFTDPAVDPDRAERDPDVIAYRSRGGRLLRCLAHNPNDPIDFTPVTADDLPDGGICTHPDCGTDLLITT